MNIIIGRILQIFFFIAFSIDIYAQKNNDLKLWYTQPSSIWEEALPLGNGKMGAMVFGGVKSERFQMNDLTLWSGAPKNGNWANGSETLKTTKEAVMW